MKRLYILLAILLWPTALQATGYYIESRVETQVRQNALLEREVPFDFYLDTGLNNLPKNGSFDVSLRNNHTFKLGTDDFDLFQAVFRLNNVGGLLDFSLGRQFTSPGVHNYLLDGGLTTIGKDDWPILVSLFGGIPRYIETGDFHGEAGLVGGTIFELQGIENLSTRLSFIYDSLDLDTWSWKNNQTVFAGFAGSYIFENKFEPNIYANAEYDIAGKIVENGTAGFSFRPNSRLYWNIEGGHYNTNRQRQRITIFSLFASGPYYQGRAGASFTVFEGGKILENLILTAGYAYQRIEVTPSLSKNGHVADGGCKFYIAPIFLDTAASYKFYDSFGGRAHDISFTLHDEPIDILSVDVSVNYTRYKKITNEKDVATAILGMVGVEAFKNFVLSVGGEYLKNKVFENEWRATAMLSYKLGGKI